MAAGGGIDPWAIGVIGAFVGSIPAAWLSYYQGKKAAENERDEEIDRRLRNAETDLARVRAIVDERRGVHSD